MLMKVPHQSQPKEFEMLVRCVGAALLILSLATIVACGGGASSNPGSPAAAAPPPAPVASESSLREVRQPDYSQSVGDMAGAIRFAKDSVTEHLKHPLDASFPFLGTDAKWSVGAKAWVVKGTVKAKNDLGGELTHAWTAIVDKRGAMWNLHRLEFDGETIYRESELSSADSSPAAEPAPDKKPYVAPTQQEKLEARSQALEQGGEAAEKVEADAAAKLRLAKQFLRMENTSSARKFLQATVKEFPGTAAAKEAEELLKTLD
jgi:hypothetical protein